MSQYADGKRIVVLFFRIINHLTEVQIVHVSEQETNIINKKKKYSDKMVEISAVTISMPITINIW